MVSADIKLKKLISCNIIYEIIKEGKHVVVYYYPNNSVMLKIKLDSDSVTALVEKRQQIIAFLDQSIHLTGTVEERWEKQIVTEPGKQIEKWVQVG